MMLKRSDTLIETLAVSEDFVAPCSYISSSNRFVGKLVNISLQFDGDHDFFFFDDGVRKNSLKKSNRFSASEFGIKLDSVIGISQVMPIGAQTSAVGFGKCLNDGAMSHPNRDIDGVSDMGGIGLLPFCNSDHALTVKQSSKVNIVHYDSQVSDGMVANSVELQCPVGNDAEGQYRAKQAERLGVCNEHVPPAEAEMCSELGRNVEKAAEMTVSDDVSINGSLHHQVTACNTKYIFFRPHRDRNFVPIGGERQSVNQDAIVKLIGWAGNLTSSGPQFCGVLSA